jgi:hypothetical protein
MTQPLCTPAASLQLLLAIIPPAEWMSGVPCFFIALALLVGIVAMLKEVGGLHHIDAHVTGGPMNPCWSFAS